MVTVCCVRLAKFPKCPFNSRPKQPLEHRGLTDQVKTMIRASSAGVSHGGHLGMVDVPTPEATNHQQLLLSHCQRYQQKKKPRGFLPTPLSIAMLLQPGGVSEALG